MLLVVLGISGCMNGNINKYSLIMYIIVMFSNLIWFKNIMIKFPHWTSSINNLPYCKFLGNQINIPSRNCDFKGHGFTWSSNCIVFYLKQTIQKPWEYYSGLWVQLLLRAMALLNSWHLTRLELYGHRAECFFGFLLILCILEL